MNEKLSFVTGAVLHTVYLLTRISLPSLKCKNDCGSLIIADLPVSIFYLAFSDGWVIFFSLLLGTVLWGFYFWLFYKLLLRIFG